MHRQKRASAKPQPARPVATTLEATVAALHARAHDQACRDNSRSVALTGKLGPELLGHGALDESFVLVFHDGAFALKGIAGSTGIRARAGLGASGLGQLAERVASLVVRSPESFLGETRAAPLPKHSGLTPRERAALIEGGVKLGRPAASKLSAAERSALEFARLCDDALDVEEAAKRLHVATSRIRQRLTSRPPSLYGVKIGRSWRIPEFQLGGSSVVPGIDAVIGALPRDLPAVAVHRWFTSPNPDLVIEDEPASPLDWLRAGRDPAKASELATAL